MNYSERIKKLVNKKWVRNDLGLAKVQFGKLISVKEKLYLLIVSDKTKEPIYTTVETMMICNNQIVVFYDGEYLEYLKYDEYDKVSDGLTKEEWEVVFNEDVTYRLDEIGVLEKEDGFLIELHENIDEFEKTSVDQEETENLKKEYGLK